jgi:serine/threonine-protein kinase
MLRFRHPNVVTLHDMIVERDRLALVMDFIAGGDLAGYRQRRGGTLPPAEAADLTAQICSALAAAHTAGIVHRDLKPANVLLDNGEVRLTDFGIARISGEPTVTTQGYFLGTLSYLAPEVIQGGEPTPACDVYAAGVTLYELLAGRPPFTGQAAAIMYGHLQGEPPRLGGIPDAAWQLITACMEKDPARRPSAVELESALRGAPQPATATRGWHVVQLPPAGDPTEIRPAVPGGTTAGMAAAPSGFLAPAAESWSAAWSEPTSLAAPTGLATSAGVPTPAGPGGPGQPRRPGPAAGRRRVAWAAGVLVLLVAAVGVTFAVTRSPTAADPSATHAVAATLTAPAAGEAAASAASNGHRSGGASAAPSASASPATAAVTGTAAPSAAVTPPPASSPSAPQSSAPRSSAAPSSTVPANTAWQCGPTAAATLYSTGADTGQTLQACIRVDNGKLELKGTLSLTVASWNEQIILVLKDASEQDHGRYESAACSAADCTYSITITPPSSGKWTVLPEWERYLGGDDFQSTGHQPGFVSV